MTRGAPSILVADTPDGLSLPVLDVTHPAFALGDDVRTVELLRRRHAQETRENARLPKWLMKIFLAFAARCSLLVAALSQPSSSYLGGIATYVMKLGPANLLPPFDGAIDRKVCASAGALSLRLRLQQIAELLAGALEEMLARCPDSSLHLINIGGGVAMDSINALILLQSRSPDLLGRPFTIHVFDIDQAGPTFGKRALAALQGVGHVLEHRDVTLDHIPYDWKNTRPLRALIKSLGAQGGIVVASTEGALFEYGDDDDILANLDALHADGHGAAIVAGSVTRSDPFALDIAARSRFAIKPRGAEAFSNLIKCSHYAQVESLQGLTSDQILLKRM